MGIISKALKYGIVFITGYYIGMGGCSEYLKEKQNNLEKKVQEQYNGRPYKDSK